jgi:hypothetical protein
MFGRPAVHIRFATVSTVLSLSLLNATVAVSVPLAAAGGLQRTTTVLSAGAVRAGENVHIVLPALHPLPAANENQVEVDEMTALVMVKTPTLDDAVFETVMF